MYKRLNVLALCASIAAIYPVTGLASTIENACMRADRPAATRILCGCIQDVADLTLSASEQRKAARFFADPHEAQEVRQSNNRSDQRFWTRYKQFGLSAKNYCG